MFCWNQIKLHTLTQSDKCNLDFPSRNFPQEFYRICIFLKQNPKLWSRFHPFIHLSIFSLFLSILFWKTPHLLKKIYFLPFLIYFFYFFTFLIIDIFTRNLCISKFESPLWILATFHIFVYDNNGFVLCMPNVSLSSLTFSLNTFGHFTFSVLKTFYHKGIADINFFENNLS